MHSFIVAVSSLILTMVAVQIAAADARKPSSCAAFLDSAAAKACLARNETQQTDAYFAVLCSSPGKIACCTAERATGALSNCQKLKPRAGQAQQAKDNPARAGLEVKQ